VRTRPLTEVSGRDLRPLLEEESAHWHGELFWDYSDVSHAVQSGVDRHALTGFVLQDGLRSVAYCYYMIDVGRAIVGSLFVTEDHRGQGIEDLLVDTVLREALSHPGNERVECQTLFSTATSVDERFSHAGFESRLRHYLVRDLRAPVEVHAHDFRLRPVRREDLGLAAELIHRSHRNTLDAALNLTYASPAYCRAFVDTLVLRSGCGRFFPEASFLVEGKDGAQGVLLASQLSRTNAHICQVSVAPDAQGQGLGGVLMTQALAAFRREGLSTASLSVTVGNDRAYRLYTRLGFALRKPFAAHAWVRPPARIRLPA
jgi:ribosomal protein S18 acetylase RimI-like enzyme